MNWPPSAARSTWCGASRTPRCPLEVAERAQGLFPAARLLVLPGVGHLTPTEAPDQLRRVVVGGPVPDTGLAMTAVGGGGTGHLDRRRPSRTGSTPAWPGSPSAAAWRPACRPACAGCGWPSASTTWPARSPGSPAGGGGSTLVNLALAGVAVVAAVAVGGLAAGRGGRWPGWWPPARSGSPCGAGPRLWPGPADCGPWPRCGRCSRWSSWWSGWSSGVAAPAGRGGRPGRPAPGRPGLRGDRPVRASGCRLTSSTSRLQPPGPGAPDGGGHHRVVREDLHQGPRGPPGRAEPPGGGHPGQLQQPGRTGPGGQRAPGRRHRGVRGRDGHLRPGGDRRPVPLVPARHRRHHRHRPGPPRAVRLRGPDRRGQVRDPRAGRRWWCSPVDDPRLAALADAVAAAGPAGGAVLRPRPGGRRLRGAQRRRVAPLGLRRRATVLAEDLVAAPGVQPTNLACAIGGGPGPRAGSRRRSPPAWPTCRRSTTGWPRSARRRERSSSTTPTTPIRPGRPRRWPRWWPRPH